MVGWGFERYNIVGRADSLGGASNTCQEWTTALSRRRMMACKRHTLHCVSVVVVVVVVVFGVVVVVVVLRRMSHLGREAVSVGASGCFFPLEDIVA